MIVEYDANRAFRRVARIEVGQQTDELDAAMAMLDPRRDMAVV